MGLRLYTQSFLTGQSQSQGQRSKIKGHQVHLAAG